MTSTVDFCIDICLCDVNAIWKIVHQGKTMTGLAKVREEPGSIQSRQLRTLCWFFLCDFGRK